ncbi:MAG: hypothetical protein Q4A31_04410 [Corynebacterium sp.]|uniref:hypothetical protein n=1 Tax=Corynebacterium sp. TaxID=1720 RepID=UPI0026DB52FD|nr:hypothetical protein [Corynebacterium sp.]MDO4761138.1 hypothetical protein [Corynebacterium sp.]
MWLVVRHGNSPIRSDTYSALMEQLDSVAEILGRTVGNWPSPENTTAVREYAAKAYGCAPKKILLVSPASPLAITRLVEAHDDVQRLELELMQARITRRRLMRFLTEESILRAVDIGRILGITPTAIGKILKGTG